MFGWLQDLIIAGLNSSVTTECREGLTPRRSGLASLDAFADFRPDNND